jgi:apolipoprotein N-acyltransferase
LTISDARGRVLNEARSAATAVVMTGSLPSRREATLYARVGAVATWVWPVVLVLLVLFMLRAPLTGARG